MRVMHRRLVSVGLGLGVLAWVAAGLWLPVGGRAGVRFAVHRGEPARAVAGRLK
jgi:hypothetical protein